MGESPLLELTYSIDGVGRAILVEVAKGRDPPLHWFRDNYEEYVDNCRDFGVTPVAWKTYQGRFLLVTGVTSNDPAVTGKQAWKALFEPSGEQINAVTRLRGRPRWLRRLRRWLLGRAS